MAVPETTAGVQAERRRGGRGGWWRRGHRDDHAEAGGREESQGKKWKEMTEGEKWVHLKEVGKVLFFFLNKKKRRESKSYHVQRLLWQKSNFLTSVFRALLPISSEFRASRRKSGWWGGKQNRLSNARRENGSHYECPAMCICNMLLSSLCHAELLKSDWLEGWMGGQAAAVSLKLLSHLVDVTFIWANAAHVQPFDYLSTGLALQWISNIQYF